MYRLWHRARTALAWLAALLTLTSGLPQALCHCPRQPVSPGAGSQPICCCCASTARESDAAAPPAAAPSCCRNDEAAPADEGPIPQVTGCPCSRGLATSPPFVAPTRISFDQASERASPLHQAVAVLLAAEGAPRADAVPPDPIPSPAFPLDRVLVFCHLLR